MEAEKPGQARSDKEAILHRELCTIRRGMDHPLVRRMLIEYSEMRSGTVSAEEVRKGLADRSGDVRATAISIGIHNDAVSRNEIAKALDDPAIEVRIAAIGPAIRYGLATVWQVERALDENGPTGSLDLRIATKVALFGFYVSRTEDHFSDNADAIADALFSSNDFDRARRVMGALIGFYSDHYHQHS